MFHFQGRILVCVFTIWTYSYSFRVFQIIVSRWFLIRVWVTTSLKSPGLFSVFNPNLTMLLFGFVSSRPVISKFSHPCTNPLVIVPRAPITIVIIVTFMFHSFFNSLAWSRYLSLFTHSFNFILWSSGAAKSTILQILFFFVDYYKICSSGRD